MRQMMLLIIFSLGCANIPKPDTNLCIVNALAHNQKCYNLLRDYDDDGRLFATAKPLYKPANTIEDLNKNACTDPDGLANLKAFIKLLREEYKRSQ